MRSPVADPTGAHHLASVTHQRGAVDLASTQQSSPQEYKNEPRTRTNRDVVILCGRKWKSAALSYTRAP